MLCNRKFFGNPAGAKAKPQQSTLSFQSRQATTNGNATAEPKDEESNVKVEEKDPTDGSAENGQDAEMNDDIKRSPSPQVKAEDVSDDGIASSGSTPKKTKRNQAAEQSAEEDSDDQPVVKRRRKNKESSPKPTIKSKSSSKSSTAEPSPPAVKAASIKVEAIAEPETVVDKEASEQESDSASEEEKPEVVKKKREKVQATLKTPRKDPYPDWKAGSPVPYLALCTTFSLIELTTKRLEIAAHCTLFLRQVLRLTPGDLLPTIQLMINKLAADYAGIELGIGESFIMKAIGQSTGRSLAVIKADQKEIGDLGLVAAKSRSNQRTMFAPKPLTVRGVHEGLLAIAKMQGAGSQDRKVGAINKLLSSADAATAGKGSQAVDITKDKGGPSESKFLVRFLEGKLRLGLAEKTVLPALAQAVVAHEVDQKSGKIPNTEQLAKGESILKTVYR